MSASEQDSPPSLFHFQNTKREREREGQQHFTASACSSSSSFGLVAPEKSTLCFSLHRWAGDFYRETHTHRDTHTRASEGWLEGTASCSHSLCFLFIFYFFPYFLCLNTPFFLSLYEYKQKFCISLSFIFYFLPFFCLYLHV